jgi:3-hydroxyisobutyrate dehydrogenase
MLKSSEVEPSNELPKIGLIGLGRMGANMGRRLKDCDYPITRVMDANINLAKELAKELNSNATNSPSEVTRHSDVIITVVPDDAAMAAIYDDPQDSLWQGAAGKLFLNAATISPSVHIALVQRAQEIGARILETPMASSIPQAREGTLFLMCAGEKTVFDAAQPLLEALSTKAVYTGLAGTAASLKALLNLVMNINTAGLAEGLGLADALGLDLTMVREVFSQTGANSRVLETDGEDMQNHEHETYFSAAHAAKDCRIAVALAKESGLILPVAVATTQQFEVMERQGLGGLDKSGIAELTFKGRQKPALLI